MRKRLLIILAAVAAVVLTLVAYRHYRWEQRERWVELLSEHFDAYKREHGGRLPPDLQALAAWRLLEPELRRLVETGHVTYKAPTDLSLGYPYEYAIDGDGRLCKLVP